MTNPIKFFVLLLVAGLVSLVSCKNGSEPTPEPTPEPQPTLFSNPANCFMVSSPGVYTFKTLKGKTTESVGAVASAEVLWESFGTATKINKGDIVAEAYYKDGQIYFKTPSALNDGNAVIAAKDASGNILWSWHIWVCNGFDATATAQKYYNKHNGNDIRTFGAVMDRNLGATNAAINDVRSHGLLYQWGRKDPFLGCNGFDEHTPAASTLAWPDPVKSEENTGTIEYAIANPTTIIYSSPVSPAIDWYWSPVQNTTDNTRWQEKKDLYDPCPAGWTLPQAHTPDNQGLWYNAMEEQFIYEDKWNKQGFDFTKVLGDAASIWYPFTGHYAFENGMLYNDNQINIWSSDVPTDADDVSAYVFRVTIDAQDELTVSAASHGYRSIAFPTRCVAVQ